MNKHQYNAVRYGWRLPFAILAVLLMHLFLLTVRVARGKKFAAELGAALLDEICDISKSADYRAKMYRLKAHDLESGSNRGRAHAPNCCWHQQGTSFSCTCGASSVPKRGDV